MRSEPLKSAWRAASRSAMLMRLAVEDMHLEGGHRIGHGAEADALDVAGVVARAAVVIVAASLDAIVGKEREERRGHIGCVQALDDVVAAHLHIDEVIELGAIGFEEGIERVEALRLARLRAKLPAGARVEAIVQRKLQHLGHVEVAGKVVVLLAERADLHASAGAAAARVGDTFAHAHQLLNDQVAIENGWLTETGADDARRRV